MDLDEESKAILEAAKAKVEYEYMLQKKWENMLVKSAKFLFETMFGVKQGDMVEMRFFSPEKVIYDDVCMDDYGDLKVRCFHLKKDGTPRKNASNERWGNFYCNEIKHKQKKTDDRNMQAFTIKTNKSDYPFLVIADGFKSAVEVLYQQGIYDTDIISVQQMESVKSDHILIEERLTDREVLKEEVRRELQEAMPKWMPEPDGASGGADRDIYLIRTSKGLYFTSSCIGGSNYYLVLDTLEQLPGLPKED